MRIGVICPLCGYENHFHVEGYSMQVGLCDDPQDGGCGEYFGYRARKVISEVYKLERCDMSMHIPDAGTHNKGRCES